MSTATLPMLAALRSRATVVATLAVVIAAALLGTASAEALAVPPLRGRVNDLVDLLPAEAEARLTAKLEVFEERTGAQIVVLTIESLEGDPLEDFSLRVAESWGLGRQDRDDGLLLLIVRGDRKMRFEVGYGLEGELTDLESAAILDRILRPSFRAGDFAGGIEKGIDAVIGTLDGLDVIPAQPAADDLTSAPLEAKLMATVIFAVVIGTFTVVGLFGRGCSGWLLYFFLMPFYGIFPVALFGPRGGVFLVAWIVLFPILRSWLWRSAAGKAFRKQYPSFETFASSRGSGGGWSSGGGFSGGGGSFGGGGASSSW